jgi:hypothetical protein
MDNFDENDYGFFCDLDIETHNFHSSKFISTSNHLQPIQEESINDICKYNYNHNNYFYDLKNAFIGTLNIRTITLYLIISLGSIFITNKFFNKNYN